MPLPKLEDWKAPWELKGEDFDEESARKYIYTLTSDKEKLQEKVSAANTERDQAKQATEDVRKELEAAQAKGDNAEVVTELQGKLRDAESKAAAAELKATRLEVAYDKGIPTKQAHRLQGTTKEELEADADEFLESFAPSSKQGGDEDDDEEDEDAVPTVRPRRLTSPTDRGGDEIVVRDIEKDIASIPRL